MSIHNFISFCGIFILIAAAWLFSANKKIVNFRLIFWGIGLQLLFAGFIFIAPQGGRFFLFINNTVVKILDCSSSGARFVFGRLANNPGEADSLGFILAFQAFPTIIFFSSLTAVLYYLGIMPKVIKVFSNIFSRLMKVSGAEALAASSNIFVGVESALTVRPYLKKMTRSELCVVLTAGMATVASNVLALYVFTLQKEFPTIAGHLISASFLSAPAALIMAKLILPEKEKPETLGIKVEPYYKRESTIFEAVINAANAGIKVIAGIAALLIAVLGLVALVDLILGVIGERVNLVFGLNFNWQLKDIFGYLFYPFTLILGVPASDALAVSKIIGERLILTEVVSYQDLAAALKNGVIINPRSAVIATYALCGFAHVASMAIFIGGTAALVPERTADLAKLGVRALIAATLACFMTACVAGTFFTGSSILLRG